jgi:hypothetical protein
VRLRSWVFEVLGLTDLWRIISLNRCSIVDCWDGGVVAQEEPWRPEARRGGVGG